MDFVLEYLESIIAGYQCDIARVGRCRVVVREITTELICDSIPDRSGLGSVGVTFAMTMDS